MTPRQALHLKKFNYSTDTYPFKTDLESLFGISKLSMLHEYLGSFDMFDQGSEQSTIAHKIFYAHFKKPESSFQRIYTNFIETFIAQIVPHKFYYQTVPTFRVGLPGNKFVGNFHKDTFYNHKPYELNFNLSICNYQGDAGLFTEDTPNSGNYIGIEIDYGEVLCFDHIDCMHGSQINTTGKTMLSIDFRLALAEEYFDDSDAFSVNTHAAFKIGDYFNEKLIKV
jgi:hypothetical protein